MEDLSMNFTPELLLHQYKAFSFANEALRTLGTYFLEKKEEKYAEVVSSVVKNIDEQLDWFEEQYSKNED